MPIKGDFISFSYNGVHSTELGIVHVSSSDRYADALLPTIQDKAVQAPGSDGTYFFGSYYTQRPITLNIAFDSVTEDQFRRARALFGDKQSHPLVFDEEPYKVYYAKVTGTSQYNYICFGSPRVYKGEGTINFICYDPFAHTPNNCKYLNNYVVNGTNTPWYKYDNKNEWNLSAGLLSTKGTYDTFNASGFTNGFKLYNPGDVDTDFKLIVDFNATLTGIKVATAFDSEALDSTLNINFGNEQKNTNDKFLLFDSKTNIIYGLKSKNVNAKTGSVYNDWIKSGQWFKIPKNSNTQYGFYLINYGAKPEKTPAAPILQYDYLYF